MEQEQCQKSRVGKEVGVEVVLVPRNLFSKAEEQIVELLLGETEVQHAKKKIQNPAHKQNDVVWDTFFFLIR